MFSSMSVIVMDSCLCSRYPDPEPDPSVMDHSQQRLPSSSANKKHKRSGSTKNRQHTPQVQIQRSFSSSEEDLKSTPEYGSDERDSEKGNNVCILME